MVARIELEDTTPGVDVPYRPRVVNRISECFETGASHPLLPGRLRYIILHHCGLANLTDDNPHPVSDEDLNAPAMAGRMRYIKGIGRMPYHGVTTLDGANEQALPLNKQGAHALDYNDESLAWCLVGEKGPASGRQFDAAIEAVGLLVIWSGVTTIVGHTDLPGASADPKKRCPYPTITPIQFQAMVFGRLPSGWALWNQAMRNEYVTSCGLVIP